MNSNKIYIQTFGCQMNLNDTEIIKSIMVSSGYDFVDKIQDAGVIFINTCAVRENAESKVYHQIEDIYQKIKKRDSITVFAVLGCMAGFLGDKVFECAKVVNLVVGPDEYRKLPDLVKSCFAGENKLAVELNVKENYDDIVPIRENGLSAWLTIMRGCNNFCSYCVVPYSRGRERSRSLGSILEEVNYLTKEKGVKEIVLLGQNVNNYFYNNEIDFPHLLSAIAVASPDIRIRFLTSHPKNMSSELIDTIARYENICNYVHLPVQSGSDKILSKMNRKYTRERYLSLIKEIKEKIADVSISTDIIAGYPTETLADHQLTLDLIKEVRFTSAFMFRYSPREGTKAFYEIDDVQEEEKIRRLNEIIALQNKISTEINKTKTNLTFEVLIEGPSKKGKNQLLGKTKIFDSVVFDNIDNKYAAGDLVNVLITDGTSKTLKGIIMESSC